MTGYNIHFLGENDVVEMPDYKECIDDIAINRQTLKYKKDSFRKGQCELKDEKEYLSKAKIYWEREQLEFLERKRQEKELLEKNKKL